MASQKVWANTHIKIETSNLYVAVVPARDPTTLEPLGYYFILFTNESAARAYLDNMIRLHRIARTSGSMRDPFLPSAQRYLLRTGENLKQILKSFSLIPTHSRLSLRLLGKPHTPHVANVVKYGGIEALATRRAKTENMVLLWSDTGRFSQWELREALAQDGKRRNLHWMLAGQDNSITKVGRGQRTKDEDDGEEGEGSDAQGNKDYKDFPRYTIAFKDKHEARRFVREWHRTTFPLPRAHNYEEEEPPIVNAEILW